MLLVRHNKAAKQLFNSAFLKNEEAAIGRAEAVTRGVL